jgi:hypothetical protein
MLSPGVVLAERDVELPEVGRAPAVARGIVSQDVV